MNKAIILLQFNLLFSVFGLGQIPSGLFTGGNCTESESLCGSWFIGRDSNFYYVNGKEGFVKQMGRGKVVSYKDSTFFFEFDNSFRIRSRLRYTYISHSIGSADSLYLKVNVKRIDQSELVEPPLIVMEDNFLQQINKRGVFDTSFFISQGIKYKNVNIYGRELGTLFPIQFFLNPATNFHEISVVVSGEDSAYCRPIVSLSGKKDTSHFRLQPDNFKKAYPGIRQANQTKDRLMSMLRLAQTKQSYLAGSIQEIIDFMNKE